MSDRKLLIGNDVRCRLTCGVPQGLGLGSLLRNIMNNELLEVNLGGCDPKFSLLSIVTFADDVVREEGSGSEVCRPCTVKEGG